MVWWQCSGCIVWFKVWSVFYLHQLSAVYPNLCYARLCFNMTTLLWLEKNIRMESSYWDPTHGTQPLLQMCIWMRNAAVNFAHWAWFTWHVLGSVYDNYNISTLKSFKVIEFTHSVMFCIPVGHITTEAVLSIVGSDCSILLDNMCWQSQSIFMQ